MEQKTQIAKKELSSSERFTQMVMKEFTAGAGDLQLSDFQKRLIQNYFMAIDSTLKKSEEKRLKDRTKENDPAYTWENVDQFELSRLVVSLSKIGLDPACKNHINLIPFWSTSLKKYVMTKIEGYRGLELKANKYGLDVPDNVVIKLVYTGDEFTPLFKSGKNRVEDFIHNVPDAFSRGEVKGGYYYYEYYQHPEKNKLFILSLKDILKRKPKYASTEFWGGEKDIWVAGKKTNQKEKIEGWFDEMCWKTVARAAYENITIDSKKIDDAYTSLLRHEENTIADEEAPENAQFDDAEEIKDEPQATEKPDPTQPETKTETAIPKQLF